MDTILVRNFANTIDVSPVITLLLNHNTEIFIGFRWASLVAKESNWKHGKVYYPLTFMTYEQKFSFIGIEFTFVGAYPEIRCCCR